MSHRPKGKHVSIDQTNPEALGICDYTGFVFKRKDLVRQMEWRGNALIWTGFLVGRPYVDTPNEQLRPPILPPDPVPVRLPRPQQADEITWSTTQETWASETYYTWASFSGSQDGIPALSPSQRLQQLQTANWGFN